MALRPASRFTEGWTQRVRYANASEEQMGQICDS